MHNKGRSPEKFDTEHGRGSFTRFKFQLKRTNKPYKEVGEDFGLSKEVTRRWHDFIYPDKARTGRERRRRHATERQLEELYDNPLFSKFYRAVRQRGLEDYTEPIPYPQESPNGFRKRAVMLKGKKVLLCRLTRVKYCRQTVGERVYINRYGGKVCQIRRPREEADFVFYTLGSSFYFIPYSNLPIIGLFMDKETSKYFGFKDNFSALD